MTAPASVSVASPAVVERVVARTVEIAAVAGPPLDESDRAAVVERWFREDGCTDVRCDEVGNVWATARPGRDPGVVVCAHLDTVFARSVAHGVRREGDRLVGPSVGDDSVALAAIASLAESLPAAVPQRVELLATVGEEGVGNLRGARHAVAARAATTGAFIAVEGNYLGRISVTGVGSVRWRVTFRGPGGHSWEAASAPSAVHAAGRAIAGLDAIGTAATERVAVNVGIVRGGEAVNARAQAAQFDLDLRATTSAALASLVDDARAVVTGAAGAGITVDIDEIGNRPAGGIDPAHTLVTDTLAAYRRAGVESRLIASSTDANAAFAAGLPAVAVGVAYGAAEHTEHEWIDLTSLAPGLAGLVAAVVAATGRLRA